MAKKRATPRRAANVKAAQVTVAELQRREVAVENALMSRTELIRELTDSRRDLDADCGYKSTGELTASIYRELYDRMAIATRVVEVLPLESWCVSPRLFEEEEVEDREPTAFETRWTEVGKSLTMQEKSWLDTEETNPFWDYLQRVDVLSGIGSYGAILLGYDDGLDLNQAVVPKRDMELLYVRVFDETLAKISKYDEDTNSRRFGRPTEYTLTLHDSSGVSAVSTATLPTKEMTVHWTRVIHVADNLGSSELFATPRIRPVYNNIHDLRKLYGGSAEMYWKGAMPGWSIESQPQMQGEVEVDKDDLRDQLEKQQNSLQRHLLMIGLNVKSLAPQVVDPTPQIDVQLTAICIKMAIPKRIFMGSERGELASSQDSRWWNGRLIRRQARYITPRLIAPLVDRLIWAKVLPEPKSYGVEWPNLNALTEEERAKVAQMRADAMAKYVKAGVVALIAETDYLVREMGYTKEEADAMVKAATKRIEEEEAKAEEEREAAAALGFGGDEGEEPEDNFEGED